MKFGVTFNSKPTGREYRVLMDKHATNHRHALLAAAEEARDTALRAGRANIRNAGNFGRRWTDGLTGDVVVKRDSVITEYRHAVPYFSVFQFGKIIHGKPLLFIPFSFARDAQGVSARDYPGGLFRVTRKSDGLTMLWSVRTGEPKYFGKESVKIPKKFKVLEIIREVSRNIKLFFVEQLNRQR